MNPPPGGGPSPGTNTRNSEEKTSPPSSSEGSIAPWFAERVFTLLLACSWAVIGGAVGVNALIKSNNEKNQIKAAIPYPTIVTINIRDVYVPGVLAMTVCFLIVLFTTIFLFMTILRPRSFRRTFTFQAVILLTCTIWLLIVIIVEGVHYAQRSARVSATLNGVAVPQSVIQAVQKSLGITNIYRQIPYLRIAVILPWFTFLFTLICSIVLFVAASRVSRKLRDVEAPHEQEKPRETTPSFPPTADVAKPGPEVQ